MTFHDYSTLITPCQLPLAESHKKYNMLTERHLQAIWLEQRYFKNLVTPDGLPITVISPGIWNAEAGPDFRKAHIKIGNHEARGDIEIHLADESWAQHHHHLDDRYNEVVLHLSLWKPKQLKPIATKGGREIDRTYLEEALTIPLARIMQLIDLDLYPYKKFLGSGKCAHALFRGMPAAQATGFFADAAMWRLEKKRGYLQARLDNPSLQMCGGIAMALGYKNNTELFLDFFVDLRRLANRGEEELLALGIGAFGFFSPSYQEKYTESILYKKLRDIYDGMPHCHLTPRKVIVNQARPFNHPLRRLVALVKLISDKGSSDIYHKMIEHWQNCWSETEHGLSWTALRRQFCDLLPTYTDPYWNHHYLFETEPKKDFLVLIGEDLKSEVVVNTFMPLLQETVGQKGNPREMAAFQSFYNSLPASRNSKSKYLAHRFFGDVPKAKILNKAIIEQGAFQLHRDFCIHYEASCEGCPFVERYSASQPK